MARSISRRYAQTFDALFVRLGESRVELGVLEQQHEEHEARGQQPVGPADIETEIETAGVEHCGKGNVEDPRAHHDHEPQVEHGMRAPAPQEKQRHQAEEPYAGNDTDHRRRIAVTLHDRRQVRLAYGGKGHSTNHGKQRHRNTPQDRRARVSLWRARRVNLPVEERVRDHEKREPRVPEHVQPGGALRSGAEQPGRREQPGEAQGMRNGNEGGEEVTPREHQQSARSQDAVLTEQQDRGDQVIDDLRGLIDRDESDHRRKRHFGKGHRRQEDDRRDPDDRSREPAIAGSSWQRRQEKRALVRQVARHPSPSTAIGIAGSAPPSSSARISSAGIGRAK